MPEREWLVRVRMTSRYHSNKMKADNGHRLTDTAKELKMSIGSVSQDLMVARWLRTHSNEIEKCKYLGEALEFIRKKKRSSLIEEFDD
jgi:hypothetical protein